MKHLKLVADIFPSLAHPSEVYTTSHRYGRMNEYRLRHYSFKPFDVLKLSPAALGLEHTVAADQSLPLFLSIDFQRYTSFNNSYFNTFQQIAFREREK